MIDQILHNVGISISQDTLKQIVEIAGTADMMLLWILSLIPQRRRHR